MSKFVWLRVTDLSNKIGEGVVVIKSNKSHEPTFYIVSSINIQSLGRKSCN